MWAIETATRQGGILGPLRRPIRGSVAYLPDTKTARPLSMPLSSRALGILQDVPAAIGGVAFPITQDSLEYYWRKPAGPRGSVVVAHGGVRCERAAVGAAPPAQGGRPRRAGGLLPAPGRHGPSADARGCSPDASAR